MNVRAINHGRIGHLLIVLMLLVVPPNVHGQEDSLSVLQQAIAENEALLQKYPASDFTANLMFQLGELYVRRARFHFYRAMAEYEELERGYDAGELQTEPVPPKIDFSAAIEMFETLLQRYPNAPFRDKVLYRLGICHLEQGDKSSSIAFLESLSEETTAKPYLEEAYFRLGEYYFDQRDYSKAIDYYRRLLNSWDSPYFDMALYKLGWAYYNVDDYANAISTLIYLIDDVNLLEEVSTEWFGKTNADLRREAIDYVAVCFADYGEPGKARAFFQDRKDKDYTQGILLKLAEVLQKRNYYEDAIAALNILLDFYPDHPMAPIIQKQIVENYELAGEKARADEARVRFVAKYGPGSPWFERVKDDSLKQNALTVTEEFLYTLGTDAQAAARRQNAKVQYGLAVSRYQAYLEKFPHSERSSKVQFYLAECLFELGRFSEAAESYYRVVLNYPESEFAETAAFNRILAYNQALLNNGHVDPLILPVRNFLGRDPARVDSIVVLSAEHGRLVEASNDFAVRFRDSDKLPEVLMKLGEELYGLEEYRRAKETYQRVLELPTGQRFFPQAYAMIAQCAFKQNDFAESERWFQRLSEQFPDSTRFVEKAKKMIASSKFKAAEQLLADHDTLKAAEEFERVANTVSELDVAQRALFEAARWFEAARATHRALAAYEAMYTRFPKSDLAEKALLKAGLLGEELQDWPRAARNYLNLYRSNPNSEFASKGLFLAAKCYENAGDLTNARLYYDQFTRTYRNDPDRYLEAAFRKGEIAYQGGDVKQALLDFTEVADAYERFVKQNQNPEKYLAANAQFLVGEILYEEYRQIPITPPLKPALKRKRAKFERVIKAYTKAVQYKVADWAIAASYKVGLSFEEFANALLDSPRPNGLSSEALVEYNQKLWQSVLPFKKKALSAYQANVQRAAENQIDNEWVTQSKQRMEALTLELSLEDKKLGEASGSY